MITGRPVRSGTDNFATLRFQAPRASTGNLPTGSTGEQNLFAIRTRSHDPNNRRRGQRRPDNGAEDSPAMKRSLNIVVAEDEVDMQEFFIEVLPQLGHRVAGVAGDGRRLIELAFELRPDLLVTDVKMPLVDGLEAAQEIYRQFPVPIIVVSAYHDPELLERAQQQHVLAFLVKPIRPPDLAPAIAIAMQRFAEFQSLSQQAKDLVQALDNRKKIERAKGILMKQGGLSEPDAFRQLQRMASSSNRKLIDVANALIESDIAYREAQGGKSRRPR